jgi:DNA-binding transcriptional LysR family regulator
MENRNVATFIKIAELNNFTKAAHSLGYSQAAVTSQIKQLEAELGAPLFDRIGKRISLTSAGRTFLPYAKRLLQAEQEAIASVREHDELSGTVTIATSSSLAMGTLPANAMEFNSMNPKVRIVIKVSDYVEDLLAKLDHGEADLVFFMAKDELYPGYRIAAEFPEPIVFVTHPDSPLVGRHKIPIEEVLNEPFIISDSEVGYSYYFDQVIRKRGIDFQPVLEIGSVAAIIDILRRGIGVSFIPLFVVQEALERGELAELNVDFPDIELRSKMIYRSDKWVDPQMDAFLKYVKQQKDIKTRAGAFD